MGKFLMAAIENYDTSLLCPQNLRTREKEYVTCTSLKPTVKNRLDGEKLIQSIQ
jgi:hypothetical protein